jgi:thiol-disulfide isomerase/thioredoxin
LTPFEIDRPQRKVSNIISGALVVALLVGAVLMGFLETETEMNDGIPAPPFKFERFTGGQITSAEVKGKVVMLDFWATWCPPCVKEMPMLVRVAKEYEAKGVVFVAASQDDSDHAADVVGEFISHDVPGLKPFAVYSDAAVSAMFKVRALPTLYVIDRQGKIIGSQTGEVSERKVRSWLDKALLTAP